jgi:hypothetical protein
MSAEGAPAEGKPKWSRARIAGILSTVLWVLGIILTFAVPIGSPFIFLGDALLLIGFWPLLWLWKPGWPWIIFGLLNVFIGFFLEIAYVLPETNFTYEMKVVRNHLRDQHSAITWILIGAVSAIYGVVLTAKQIYDWFTRRAMKKQAGN